MLALVEAIKSVVAEFPPKEGQEDEDSVTRVFRLSKTMVKLKKQVEELQSKKVPRTPPKVFEE